MRRLSLILAGICCCLSLLAQEGRRVPIEQAIINLDLDRATTLSFQEPVEKLRYYYQARILFIRYLVNEDAQVFASFLDMSKRALDMLHTLPESDPERDLMAAEYYFLRGAVKAMDKKTVGSALEIKNACTLLYRNSQRFPGNREQMKLLGIFNVAMSSLPKKLKWLGSVLCFTGNLNLGLQQLEVAAKSSKLLPSEASLMLFYFEKNLLGKPEAAVARAKAMAEGNPESIVPQYLLLSGYLETRQADAAIALVNEKEAALLSSDPDRLPIWYYSRAKAHFFRLEYDACIKQMDRFLGMYHGKTLYADALYKKAMSLVLADRYAEARPVFHRLTQAEGSSFDVDEYALSQAALYLLREPTEVEKQLYSARNLFDGGYYQRSIKTLAPIQERIESCNENERCELWYRLGRNWQEMDSIRFARAAYVACVGTQPGRALWMKAYSHYYLGRIEEEESHYDLARREYQIALSYDNYDYQAGLEQRCKAALEQLKGKK